MRDWKTYLRYNPNYDSHDLVIRRGRAGDVAMSNGEMVRIDAASIKLETITMTEPSVPAWVNENVDMQMLQSIMDGLWENGIRPSGYVGTEAVAAMREHISDLRAIALKVTGANRD